VEHYANSFALISGHCFRMIQAEDGTGHAQHCPYAVLWRGRFQDGAGKWWTVSACDGHRADLTSVQKVTGPPGVAQEARKRPFWT
jgi:hypothetical protein